MKRLDGIINSMDMTEETLGDDEGRKAWHTAVHRDTKCWTRLSE